MIVVRHGILLKWLIDRATLWQNVSAKEHFENKCFLFQFAYLKRNVRYFGISHKGFAQPSASWNPNWRGMLSTIDLLALTSLYQLLLILKKLLTFKKTSYLNEEVNRTEPSPPGSVPCLHHLSVSSMVKIELLNNKRVCP